VTNFLLFSTYRNGDWSYYIGIAGFWIDPTFWYSTSGLTLLLTHLFTLIQYNWEYIKREYTDIIIVTLFFCFVSSEVESRLRENNMFHFILIAHISSLIIAELIIKPLKLFTIRRNALEYLYSVSSACLVFLAMNPSSRDGCYWKNYYVRYSNLSLVLIITQILLEHTMGFSGSLSGLLLSYLAVETQFFRQNFSII